MASSASSLSDEELISFHSIDRDLYSFLVLTLSRDPFECLEIMAFWIWLEQTKFTEIVKRQLSLPYVLVNELADEALTCLNCIRNMQFTFSSENYEIPLIQTLSNTEISLQFLHENRLTIIQDLGVVRNKICARAFRDIMQAAIGRKNTLNSTNEHGISTSFGQHVPQSAQTNVQAVDRTMFLTFSRGHPVQEWELREFFTLAFGDCVESLHVQEVQPGEQSLYARIVFHTPATVAMILNGNEKAKFIVNGKHVWARKFEARRQRFVGIPSHFSQR